MTAPLAVDHRPGPGPLVVFLHAGVADRRSWADALPAGASTLTYDRRGFGRSPLPGQEFTHLGDLRDLLATHGPAVLVGSSMGGGLALDAALELPELVRGLVLLAPAVSGAPEPQEADPRTLELDAAAESAAAAGDVERTVELEAQLWLDGPRSAPGRVGGAARELFRDMDRIAVRNQAFAHGHCRVEAWSRLGELRVPVTIATGDLDCGYLLTRTTELLERVPGARRADLPGTAHLPYLERPDLVRNLVEEFLQHLA
ncbi:alpha/beta fold hydrolase [Kineococcus sp. SYSU DK003]|uniref:alpha/beta fold hydrolase n=1 Tax=Kineococcus sp. SYSU DK003 TaxID=3383124 RepID=UPI003D7C36A5